MNEMSKRGDALENKFFHDETQRLKAVGRRNRLLGLWAAEMLGKSSEDVEAYAREVIIADLTAPGDSDVIAKIMTDFTANTIPISEDDLREKMASLLQEVLDEMENS